MRTIFWWSSGESPVMAENARSHVFTKEINHASIGSQHVNGNGNFYVKIVYECFLP